VYGVLARADGVIDLIETGRRAVESTYGTGRVGARLEEPVQR
jgi:hypothetical protein